LIRFFFWLMTFAGVIFAGLKFFIYYGLTSRQPSFLFPTLILLVFSTAVIYRYLYHLKKPEFFIQLYLLLMVVKIIAYLGYNVLMVLKDRQGAAVNVIFFMVGYFIFTTVEIFFLYRHVNTGSRPSN
jgi:hypothetical protein